MFIHTHSVIPALLWINMSYVAQFQLNPYEAERLFECKLVQTIAIIHVWPFLKEPSLPRPVQQILQP